MRYVNAYYQRHTPTRSLYTTSNLAVPLDRFRSLGGFSQTFQYAAGEDYDFCARWYQAGFSSSYAPEAVVGHAHGHDLRTFWRQHFTYGRALLRVRQRMARRTGRRGVTVERPHFYGDMLLYPLRQPGGRRWLYAALVLLSQIATAAGAGRELLLNRNGTATEPLLDHPA
jgi:GT2 family glycosyltransferase